MVTILNLDSQILFVYTVPKIFFMHNLLTYEFYKIGHRSERFMQLTLNLIQVFLIFGVISSRVVCLGCKGVKHNLSLPSNLTCTRCTLLNDQRGSNYWLMVYPSHQEYLNTIERWRAAASPVQQATICDNQHARPSWWLCVKL